MKQFFCLLFVVTCFSITSFAQFGKRSLDNYQPGYFYDSLGNKVEGLLKFKYGGGLGGKKNGDCVLLFKTDRKDKKDKYTPDEISSFVIGKDSFAVVRNFSLNAFVYYPMDFAKVNANGKINIYTYYALISQGQYGNRVTKVFCLLEKDNKVITVKKRQIKKVLKTYYYIDYPELASKLSGKKQRLDDLPAITKLYNAHFDKVVINE